MLMKEVSSAEGIRRWWDSGEVEKVALWIQSVRYLCFSEKLKNVKFPKF